MQSKSRTLPDNRACRQHANAGHRTAPAVFKYAGRLALLAVLAVAFLGYLTPDMRIQWANLMTLCGL